MGSNKNNLQLNGHPLHKRKTLAVIGGEIMDSHNIV